MGRVVVHEAITGHVDTLGSPDVYHRLVGNVWACWGRVPFEFIVENPNEVGVS